MGVILRAFSQSLPLGKHISRHINFHSSITANGLVCEAYEIHLYSFMCTMTTHKFKLLGSFGGSRKNSSII